MWPYQAIVGWIFLEDQLATFALHNDFVELALTVIAHACDNLELPVSELAGGLR